MIEKLRYRKKMLEEFYEDRHNLLNKLIVLKTALKTVIKSL